jgi:nitroreductase
MEFQDVLRSRRAVRDFKPASISPAILRRLAEAAVQAPNSMNEQPWRFSIVTDPAMLLAMSDAAKRHLVNCLPVIPKQEHFRPLFSDPATHLFHHAPALVVISADSANPWAVEDCALAAENLMLAACDLGLGTCWVGFSQTWLNGRDGRAMLDIPISHHVVAPIVIGYPKTPATPVQRRAPDIVWIHAQGESLHQTLASSQKSRT